MIDDAELLRSYAKDRSQAAFTTLVQRHANLVYSVALRQVGGDVHLAQDVMQKVFADLARKASSLSQRAVIAGWLYRGTKFAAADLVRAERRRRQREEETGIMQDHREHPVPGGGDLEVARPVIDEVMAKLGDTDRDAVALRFFENRSFLEVGRALNLSEEAARKRVDRALEKMRTTLLRRGIPSGVALLTTALSGQVAVTAPADLVATVASGVFATGGVATGGVSLFFMSLTKIQIAATVGIVAATAGAISLYYQSGQIEPRPTNPTEVIPSDAKTIPSLPVATQPSATKAAAPVVSSQAASNPGNLRRITRRATRSSGRRRIDGSSSAATARFSPS